MALVRKFHDVRCRITAFGRRPAAVDTARNPSLFTRFTIYIDLNWRRISAASPVALAIPFLHAPPKKTWGKFSQIGVLIL